MTANIERDYRNWIHDNAVEVSRKIGAFYDLLEAVLAFGIEHPYTGLADSEGYPCGDLLQQIRDVLTKGAGKRLSTSRKTTACKES